MLGDLAPCMLPMHDTWLTSHSYQYPACPPARDSAYRMAPGPPCMYMQLEMPGGLAPKRVCHFGSRDDLVAALLASCHIPLLSTGELTTAFKVRRRRGHACMQACITLEDEAFVGAHLPPPMYR